MTWVKICGITSFEALEAAVEAGADAVGFVFEPNSPRFVGNRFQEVRSWLERIPEQVDRVAVVGDAKNLPQDLEGFTWVQWVIGDPNIRGCRRLKVLRLGAPDTTSGQDAERLLLDAYHTDAWGGTGRTIDWAAAAAFVQTSPLPVVLAGGLTAGNVAEALRRVRPFGVDVSSGVESAPGVKDRDLIYTFIRAVRDQG